MSGRTREIINSAIIDNISQWRAIIMCQRSNLFIVRLVQLPKIVYLEFARFRK